MANDYFPDFRHNPIRQNCCVEFIIEDIPGGGTIAKSDFKSDSTVMNEGALLGIDNTGIYHIVKTAKVWNDTVLNASGINVYKEHEFKVGDIIGNSAKTATARNILSIDTTPVSYDTFNISSGFGTLLASDLLIEMSASGVSGGNFKYIPVCIGFADEPVNLLNKNNGCGLLVSGRVKKDLMPYYTDAIIEKLLPSIRFV